MRKKREADNVNTSSWLNTYADMITLLLCFFVAIYAFSNVDKAKFDTMVQSFRPGESSGNGSNVNIEDLGLDEDELERIRIFWKNILMRRDFPMKLRWIWKKEDLL